MILPIQSTRIAIAASPALLKIALMMNSIITTVLPASTIVVYPDISLTITWEAPMISRRSFENIAPGIAMITETNMPVRTA